MTETLQDQEQGYDAALARITAYREQLERADRQADENSLDRAADLEVLYQSMRWVDEMPAVVRKVYRGRPVDPHSWDRFGKWVMQTTGLHAATVSKLHQARQMVTNYLDQVQIIPQSERALRPLARLKRAGYADRIPDVYKRAVELAEGRPPTSAETGQAVRDYLAQFTTTQRTERKSADWLEQRRKAIIRDFTILLEMEQYATAEEVLNQQLAAYHARVPQDTQ